MATYASLTQLRGPSGYLDQQFTTSGGVADTSKDTVLTQCLVGATAYVNRYIKAPSNLTAAALGTRVLRGNGLQSLVLPPYVAGSVTLITVPTGYTVPGYIEQDGHLVLTDSSGIVLPAYRDYGLYAPQWNAFTSSAVWQFGVPYTVSATFGWSADDLAILTEATLEIAVQFWRYKDTGGSETIFAEDAVTTVRAGFTPLVKQGLDDLKERVRGFSGGVW